MAEFEHITGTIRFQASPQDTVWVVETWNSKLDPWDSGTRPIELTRKQFSALLPDGHEVERQLMYRESK